MVSLFAGAVMALSGAVSAHPHGTMQCGLAVHFQEGRPHTVQGRLLTDQQHSSQAQALMRDPASGLVDTGRQQRLLFTLRLQMARFSWFLSAAAEGQALDLAEASEPTLLVSDDGRVGVNVELRVEPGAAVLPGTAWKFSCQDPSWYWVSEFVQHESPLTVTGCAQPATSPVVKVTTGPLAGSVHVDVRCAS